MKKRLKRNYVFRFILFFIFIALIAAIVFGNFFVAPYITNITTADSIRYPDKKIVNVEVENYFFKFNKTTWCLLVETNGVPNVNDSGWVKANNGYCSFITDLSSYDVYVKDSYGNISDVDKRKQKEKNIKKIPMSNENIYLYPTQQQKVNVNDENIQTVQWKSDDEKIATVDNNGIISGISAGTTTIKAIYKENYYGEVKVIVTNLIEKPDASAKKEYVPISSFFKTFLNITSK